MDLLAILNLDDVPPYENTNGQPNSPSQESTPSPRTPPRYCALAHLDDDEAEWSVRGHSPQEPESRNRSYESGRRDWQGPEIGAVDSRQATDCSEGWIFKQAYSPSTSDSSQQLSPVSWRENYTSSKHMIKESHPQDHREGPSCQFHLANTVHPPSSIHLEAPVKTSVYPRNSRNSHPSFTQACRNPQHIPETSSENMSEFKERLPSLIEVCKSAVSPSFVRNTTP